MIRTRRPCGAAVIAEMKSSYTLRQPGVFAALGAALLFGSGTPLAKGLLTDMDPWVLAGLLYLGSGLGLSLYRAVRPRTQVSSLPRGQWLWFAGAIIFGGILGPVLLMFGLQGMPASSASLLLNAEGVFTALLAWFAFGENFDRRIALGMAAIVAGALALSWPQDIRLASLWPALAILGACFAWGLDNNFTRKVSLTDATWIAAVKGLTAGSVNLALAFIVRGNFSLPPLPTLAGALVVGCLAYGVSLSLFVLGLRHLGTARTGAYFSIAPFFGAVLAIVLLDEPIELRLLVAAALMAVGVWLHLTERHVHEHGHPALEHDHEHEHDEHHRHPHAKPISPARKHAHTHRHLPMTHAHAHFPDSHHRHDHE
jgi:drug/metabolite transporter (DMT)-like permease